MTSARGSPPKRRTATASKAASGKPSDDPRGAIGGGGYRPRADPARVLRCHRAGAHLPALLGRRRWRQPFVGARPAAPHRPRPLRARKSVVEGTSVSEREDLGGRRTITQKKTHS